MKTSAAVFTLVFSLLATAPQTRTAQAQSLLSGNNPIEFVADPSAGGSQDDSAYADGVRAVNSGHWSEAIAIFSRVAAGGGTHADGALYWKAYAENKQGQGGTALETCSVLRRDHSGSNWIEDCGALEIEIHAKNGQPVQPQAEQGDDLKLLALASLMQHDEKGALQQIDEILNSDASEKLKHGALLIMGEHHTDTVYPQIARLSFADGDVRIERDLDKSHRKEVTWEAAASGVPLESGYSIVTGDGRAEIELENASTLYLAPNSVLTVNDLSTTAGVPHTELALLSGTVALHVHPYVAGETFQLLTPTDSLFTRYPATASLRITSYLDGIAIASLGSEALGLGGKEQPLAPGQTLYFKNGQRIMDAGPTHPPDFTSWDQWVATRFAARTAAAEEVMKASGLGTPLPGMADMEGEGHFFDCAPYGKCWEPNAATPEHSQAHSQAADERAQAALPAQAASTQERAAISQRAVAQSASAQTPTPATSPGRNIGFIGPPAASGPPRYSGTDAFLPCIPGDVRALFRQGVLPAARQYSMQPWAWTICHTGSWIYQGNRYVWVAGHRHHRPCVHWIKSGHTVAFVPIHPHDVKDHLPVNRKASVFALDTKNGRSIDRIAFDNKHPIELLKEPPKEFRNEAPMPLRRVAEPRMEGHQIRNTLEAKGPAPRATGIPITFNHHSQTFMMPNHAMEGARPSTGFVPITNRGGGLQAHAGSFNGGGGFHGSFSGGGSHGVASGGSFHGGGGGSVASGGGGFHGGGSSGGSVSSGSSGGSSGGAAGGGGGSHK